MILSIYVISLYCNIKHLLKLENICINLDLRMTNASILRILAHATPTPTSRSKGQKSKSRGGGILWRPPSRTACFYYYFTGCMYVGKKLYIYKKLRSSKTRVTSDFGCCGKYIAMCNVVPLCFGSCLGLYFSASSVASQSKGISRS